jgi:hypothetical protein
LISIFFWIICCLRRNLSSLFVSSELVRNSRNHAVQRRTPLIPVIAPADRSTIDEPTPGIENVINFNSTKRKYEAANHGCAVAPTNKYSSDRVSGFAETYKADQGHSYLDTMEIGDIAMCQQHFKKTRIQQTVEESQTGIVEHETTMASKEGNKLVSSVNNNQILIDSISEGIFSNWFILFTSIVNILFLKVFLAIGSSFSLLLSTYSCFIQTLFSALLPVPFSVLKYFIIMHYYGIYSSSDMLTFCILDFQAMFWNVEPEHTPH